MQIVKFKYYADGEKAPKPQSWHLLEQVGNISWSFCSKDVLENAIYKTKTINGFKHITCKECLQKINDLQIPQDQIVSIKEIPTKQKQPKNIEHVYDSSRNGLLDRNGVFYECAFGEHIDLFWELVKEGKINVQSEKLENYDMDTDYPVDNGWVKIQQGKFYTRDLGGLAKTIWGLSQAQLLWIKNSALLRNNLVFFNAVLVNIDSLNVSDEILIKSDCEYVDINMIGNKAKKLLQLVSIGVKTPDFVIIPKHICLNIQKNGWIEPSLFTQITRTLGNGRKSVRSSGVVSMPGMQDTLLDREVYTLSKDILDIINSWNNPRAVKYRTAMNISHEFNGGVIIQNMVYGDKPGINGSGIARMRAVNVDPINYWNTEFEIQGDFLPNSKGDVLVGGQANTLSFDQIPNEFKTLYNDIHQVSQRIYSTLTKRPQEIEFTVQDNELFVLQTRDYTWRENTSIVLTDDVLNKTKIEVGKTGCPGIVTGNIVTKYSDFKKFDHVIYVAIETSPDDVQEILAANGVLTGKGGALSHAAIIANNNGIPALVGTGLTITNDVVKGNTINIQGHQLREFQEVTIDCNNKCIYL